MPWRGSSGPRNGSSPRRWRHGRAWPLSCAMCWAATPTAPSPTRWRVFFDPGPRLVDAAQCYDRSRERGPGLMRKPRALSPGARLALVAPASAFDPDEFHRGVEEIRQLGFEPVYEDSVFHRQRYLAGSAEVRAAAIREAWRDPSIAGLIAVRGGFGSMQVLPLLNAAEVRRTPKPFVGYSDLTAVLTFLTTGCEVVAFHGPMLAGRFARGAA